MTNASSNPSLSEAEAVANFISVKYGTETNVLNLCFDVGGSTTDISALFYLKNGVTMIKQNSLRFAAQRVSQSVAKFPQFKRVLSSICADLLDIEYGITGAAQSDDSKEISRQAIEKRNKKHKYARQPLFWRSTAYFLYRYILKGAFLEGKEGFLFTFIQGWWYRTLVDAKVLEIKRKSGCDPQKIKQILHEEYNIGF